MASEEVRIVLSTLSDGRAQDVRFRQNQFHSLHRWIISHVSELEAAIRSDSGFSNVQARFVISSTLQNLRRNYDTLDLKKALQSEYSVKLGHNSENGSVPEDLVYIIPERYTLFNSVFVALFACIAAGSCCLIEVTYQRTPFLTQH